MYLGVWSVGAEERESGVTGRVERNSNSLCNFGKLCYHSLSHFWMLLNFDGGDEVQQHRLLCYLIVHMERWRETTVVRSTKWLKQLLLYLGYQISIQHAD